MDLTFKEKDLVITTLLIRKAHLEERISKRQELLLDEYLRDEARQQLQEITIDNLEEIKEIKQLLKKLGFNS